MGLYTIQEWERAIDDGARYHVQVCWADWQPAGKGMRDTSHVFGSKVRAERFAMALSRYLPGPVDGLQVAWILVSALAASRPTAVSGGPSHCYLAIDAGAVVVKRHDPVWGYYGAPVPVRGRPHVACDHGDDRTYRESDDGSYY